MKSILYYFGYVMLLLMLTGVLFTGKVVNASSSIKEISSYRYSWDYDRNYQTNPTGGIDFDTMYIKPVVSDFPIEGYFGKVQIRTNSNTNFYQYTDKLTFKVHPFALSCDVTTKIEGYIYALDESYTVSTFDYLKDFEVYYGVPDWAYDESKMNLCETERMDNNVYKYSCTHPRDSNMSNYIRIVLKDKVYSEISTTNSYAERSFMLGISNTFNYECFPLPTPKLSITNNKGTVKVTVDNFNDFENYSDFNRFQVRSNAYFGALLGPGFYFSREKEHVFENLPNGTYNFQIKACVNGHNCGASSAISITVDDSLAPVPILEVSDEGSSIILDGSGSYTSDNSTISKYYYSISRLDSDYDSGWIESTDSTYTFSDLEYANYYVKFKVEDSNGHFSMVFGEEYPLRSPWDKFVSSVNGFFSDIGSFFTNFFSELGTFFLRIVIPEKSELENRINSLQNTFSQKLGFLGESANFIIDELEYLLVNPGSFTSICLPQTSMPSEMSGLEIIPEGQACLTASTMYHFRTITTIIKTIFNLLLIGWFVNYCYHELVGILGGVSISYDYK